MNCFVQKFGEINFTSTYIETMPDKRQKHGKRIRRLNLCFGIENKKGNVTIKTDS